MSYIHRQFDEIGYYHLILRGNSKQIIFEERSDFLHFLRNLKQYSAEQKINICAFCLMENHVHLLVFDSELQIPMFMKRLAGNYSLWYNRKYKRTGHLFEGRYTCRRIDSDASLCRVLRYILNNPRKAGICSAAEYPWSSYDQYGQPDSFVDTAVFVEMLGSFEEYAAYINAGYDDEIQESGRNDDEQAKKILQDILNVENGFILQTYSKKERNDALRKLKNQGISIRSLERLTGISKSVIQRVFTEVGQ